MHDLSMWQQISLLKGGPTSQCINPLDLKALFLFLYHLYVSFPQVSCLAYCFFYCILSVVICLYFWGFRY